MRLPVATEGEDVVVRGKRIPFSFWPTFRGTRREGLQWTLFASDPWFLIESAISGIDESARAEANAFLLQARDFYKAATNSDISAAKPLLLYYSFLNLAKCYVGFKLNAPVGAGVMHGLSEKLPATPGAIHGNLRVLRNQDAVSAFAKLTAALNDRMPTSAVGQNYAELRSQDFLAQILIGHRMWCRGDGINERFISLRGIRFRHDPITREIWLTVRMYKDDLTRFGYSMISAANALSSGPGGAFHSVACSATHNNRELVEFELTNKASYPNRPSESLQSLANIMRKSLWRSVTSYPPYRKYYIYIPTRAQRIGSQLQSLYLAAYYFGSITRYKPQSFNEILRSPIGPFVQEFFTNQPSQILYLMASEFAEQEVTKAAIA